MNLDWNIIASIGELLGGIGVIVTLIYLSLQIRQNTKVTRAATAQQMTNNWVAINMHMSAQPRLFERESLADLPRGEYYTLLAFWRAIFHQWSSNHYQFTHGALDEALFIPTKKEISVYASDPSISANLRQAWESTRFIYNEEFQVFMDEILANHPEKSSDST